MKILNIFNNLAQIVKPYDPSTLPEEVSNSNSTSSLTPIIIMAGLGVLIFIVVGLLIYRKRR